MSNLNILQKALNGNTSDITFLHEPFPVMVIKDALPEDLYNQLSDQYPNLKTCFQLDDKGHKVMHGNTRYQINADKGLNVSDDEVSPLWKEFIKYHTSKEFLDSVIKVFGNDIRKTHPTLEGDLNKKMEDWTTAVRWRSKKVDLVMDCQPGVNSPVFQKSSVKGPHVDNKVELYAGLLYMRRDNDDSKGGSLEIYSHPNGQYKLENHPQWGKNTVIDPNLKRILSVPYQKNCFAFFINSRNSLHGVSDRNPTFHPRRLVNIIGELRNHPNGGLWKKK